MCIRDSLFCRHPSRESRAVADDCSPRALAERGAFFAAKTLPGATEDCGVAARAGFAGSRAKLADACLLYTSDADDERSSVELGGRRIIKKKKNIANM